MSKNCKGAVAPTVKLCAVNRLKPSSGNPRTHSKAQIEQIKRSIVHFGWTSPILVDEEDRILCGHGRIAAARLLGMVEVPTICLAGLSEADRRAYILADNKLALNVGWDLELLRTEFEFLLDPELDFSIDLTGFDTAEIDTLMLDEASGEAQTDEEHAPVPDPAAPVVSRPGDLWHIGSHRILCGDARSAEALDYLLAGETAQFVITDPPYNVPIAGHVSGLGETTHREFAMASGEMTPDEFVAFLRAIMIQLARCSADGSIHMIFMDWRHMREVLAAADGIYTELKNLCVWAKTNAGMGSFYRSQHELVFVFKAGTGRHINNFGLGDKGRYRTNLWTFAGVNGFGPERAQELAAHPTCKPVALLVEAILDCSDRGGLVLDVFGGSGSMLVAAHRTGRRGAAIEIDPIYVDLIVARMEKETGTTAKLATGESFAGVAARRVGLQEAA